MTAVSALLGSHACIGCGSSLGPLCRPCRGSLAPARAIALPTLDRVSACWRHEGAARGLVLGLKLGGRRNLAEPLIGGLSERVQTGGTAASVVAWPPCSRADRRRRGFDHAEVLARGLAARLGLQAQPLLRRTGRSYDQSGLTGPQRRSNLVNVFEAAGTSEGILLVDDVVTTGATLQACAEALLGSGAGKVEAVVACSAFS